MVPKRQYFYLLVSLKGKEVKVTVLLLEDGGALRDEIPDWVDVQIIELFDSIKPIIFDTHLDLIKEQLKKKEIGKSIGTLGRYAKVKLSKSWYLNYAAALAGYTSIYSADIAIAFAGPSFFISYLVLEKVQVEPKMQCIHLYDCMEKKMMC